MDSFTDDTRRTHELQRLVDLSRACAMLTIAREGPHTVAVYLPDGTRTEFDTHDKLAAFICESINSLEDIVLDVIDIKNSISLITNPVAKYTKPEALPFKVKALLTEIYVTADLDKRTKERIAKCLGLTNT